MHTAASRSGLRETLTPEFTFCNNGAATRPLQLNWLNLALPLDDRGGCATAAAVVCGAQQVRSSEDAMAGEVDELERERRRRRRGDVNQRAQR
jgi:hypothetical protein